LEHLESVETDEYYPALFSLIDSKWQTYYFLSLVKPS
jgi:hypothetical protein